MNQIEVQAEVYETLSGRKFGILLLEGGESTPAFDIEIHHNLATRIENFDEFANMCRGMVEQAMRHLSGSEYSYPRDEKLQVGNID